MRLTNLITAVDLHACGETTGIHQFVVDPSDPYPNGFTVGDIW